jgi:2-keto-4-pentenoate hydratase/2-oxohepta-3-ene-1,7-dioic acid hydratase in catechol pathway
MKFISFRNGDTVVPGLWLGEQVLDLAAAARAAGSKHDFSSMLAIVRGGDTALAEARTLAARAGEFKAALRPSAGVTLLSPLPELPRNAFCVGRNYVDHVKEGAAMLKVEVKLPTTPQYFTKATHSLNTPNGDIRLDTTLTSRFDYEAELAIVLGRGGRDIPPEQAMDHVFGYTVANDFTARDLQRRHDQWFKGKSLDTTLPLGPWLIDAQEIGDPKTLELTLTVNGKLRQHAHISQMIFDLPTIISVLSAGLTLEAGDVIVTGTPSGVGFAMDPPAYLQDGDVVVTRIDRIGELRNRIVKVK